MIVKLALYAVEKDEFIDKLHKATKTNLEKELCRFYFTEKELFKINDDGAINLGIKFVCYDNFAKKIIDLGKYDKESKFIQFIDTLTPFYKNKSAREVLNVNSNCISLTKDTMKTLINYVYDELSNEYESNAENIIENKKQYFNHNDRISLLRNKDILLSSIDLESLYYNLIYLYKTFDYTYNELFLYYE